MNLAAAAGSGIPGAGAAARPPSSCNITPGSAGDARPARFQIEVPALTSEELLAGGPGEASAAVRERVMSARARQRVRARSTRTCQRGARGGVRAMRRRGGCRRCGGSRRHERPRSARALRVARTIADLAARSASAHLRVAEALQYGVRGEKAPGRLAMVTSLASAVFLSSSTALPCAPRPPA